MSNYRVLQLTNTNVGAVATNDLMPYGTITRKICYGNTGSRTFDVSTTGANTITLNETGNYRITYSASLVIGTAGVASVALLANSSEVYEVGSTVATAGDTINLTLVYEVRVLPNCCSNPTNSPMTIQVQLTGQPTTGGTTNMLVERVY